MLIGELLGEHLILAYVPSLVGVLVSVPLGILCARWKWIYPPTLFLSTIIFAVPSLALFVFMLPITGLTSLTAIIPLSLYAVSLLIRSVVDGIRSTDEAVRQSATAMGYSPLHRLVAIELPIAAPVILGGLRVVTVAAIGSVAVTSVLGIPSLGSLFVDGTQRFFLTPIIVGIILTAAVAVITDLVLVALQRRLTPWARRERS